jgi:NAD-dependent SIR2 family protein deacetylase
MSYIMRCEETENETCENCDKEIKEDELDKAVVTEDGVWLCPECYEALREDR